MKIKFNYTLAAIWNRNHNPTHSARNEWLVQFIDPHLECRRRKPKGGLRIALPSSSKLTRWMKQLMNKLGCKERRRNHQKRGELDASLLKAFSLLLYQRRKKEKPRALTPLLSLLLSSLCMSWRGGKDPLYRSGKSVCGGGKAPITLSFALALLNSPQKLIVTMLRAVNVKFNKVLQLH